jgi:hypothetical protein
MEINPCFLFALRYLREKNSSKDIAGSKCLKFKVPQVSQSWKCIKDLNPKLNTFSYFFLMWGKRITSLMEGESVRTITNRSIPTPSPAVGGSPYSRALI